MTVCTYWNAGKCTRGAQCTLAHPTQVCYDYQGGHCSKGKACARMHPSKQCNKYPHCLKGVNCRFRHVGGGAAAAGGGGGAQVVNSHHRAAAALSLLDADELHVRKLKPVLVFLVNIDVSGSMRMNDSRRLTEALTALERVVTKVMQSSKHKVFYGCTAFNHEVHVLHKPMPQAKVEWKRDHDNIVDLCEKQGQTAVYDAAINGIEQLHQFHREYTLENNEFAVYEHLLITDGCDSSSSKSLADAASKIAKPGLGKYHFHAVSVGIDATGAGALETMVEPKHAHHVSAKNAAELSSVLDDAREMMFIRVEAHGQEASRVVSMEQGVRMLADAMGGGSAHGRRSMR